MVDLSRGLQRNYPEGLALTRADVMARIAELISGVQPKATPPDSSKLLKACQSIDAKHLRILRRPVDHSLIFL